MGIVGRLNQAEGVARNEAEATAVEGECAGHDLARRSVSITQNHGSLRSGPTGPAQLDPALDPLGAPPRQATRLQGVASRAVGAGAEQSEVGVGRWQDETGLLRTGQLVHQLAEGEQGEYGGDHVDAMPVLTRGPHQVDDAICTDVADDSHHTKSDITPETPVRIDRSPVGVLVARRSAC